jgi:membrane-associated phospholipid phosphatase
MTQLLRDAASCVYATLWRLLVSEGYFWEFVGAGVVLGINYGVTSRVHVTLRATPDQLVGSTLVHDASLLRLYTENHTISGTLLFGLSFGLPAALVVILNVLEAPRMGGRLGAAALSRGTRDVHHLMLSVLQAYALATCFKNWLNKGVGRQRPDWYGRLATGDKGVIAEGRASYPSGHAAYSHTSGAVCFWYLAGRLAVVPPHGDASGSSVWTGGKVGHGQFLRLLVALMPVGLATYIATTRLTDGVHHFSDVNAGTFIGLCCGTICYHLNYASVWSGGDAHGPRVRIAQEAACATDGDEVALREVRGSLGEGGAPSQ